MNFLFFLGKTINDGIESLREGCNSDHPVQELWLPFKNMFQQLQHINYRRSVLKLDDVSPALKHMKSKNAPFILFTNSLHNFCFNYSRYKNPYAGSKRQPTSSNFVYKFGRKLNHRFADKNQAKEVRVYWIRWNTVSYSASAVYILDLIYLFL